MTGRYDFSNVKFSKMLSFDAVAEAHGLIYPPLSGENFSFAKIYALKLGILAVYSTMYQIFVSQIAFQSYD